MSEAAMVELVQRAMAELRIDDVVVAVGEFSPRGHTGGAFVGGMLGGEVGGVVGGLGDAVGVAAGFVAGQGAVDASSGLPSLMLVGVSETMVYGFAGRRTRQPSELLFQLPRAGLTVKVHQRVNVRVVELIEEASGSRIELEGNRLPMTHAKDVIELLS